MGDIVLFHHAQGLTKGCLLFADQLRSSGHHVHTPDLYEGRTFTDLADGASYAEDELGMEVILDRAALAADDLPHALIYAGFSLGAVPAQMLAQTRAGARGGLLFHGCVPPSEFHCPWPPGVPLQIHTMDADPWIELDVARKLAAEADDGRLFLYRGDQHLFADCSLADYEPDAAALLMERVLGFVTERG